MSEAWVGEWIGVDFDRTLCVYDEWKGLRHCGAPIKPMVRRVKKWLAEGRDVRIFTARITGPRHGVSIEETIQVIQDWCEKHVGARLPVTNVKDVGMIELWDDKAVQVVPNTGKMLGRSLCLSWTS